MIAASLKGNKRNKGTTKAPPRAPPRRSARIEKKLMWDRLRNTNDVMRHVNSFLSIYDRVHVAEVDRTFRDDEDRGTVVGSYGDEGLDLLKAFEKIKKWHNFEMSPDCTMDETSMLYRREEIEIRPEWYTPEEGWNLERIMNESAFSQRPDYVEEALQFYSEMNQNRVDMKRTQEEIQQTYPMRPDLAPFRTLFSLLRKHNLERLADQFMKAREPELHHHNADFENVMLLHKYDENRDYIYSTAMPHLRPGRKVLAGPPKCKPILLNQCVCCNSIKEDIRTEGCSTRHCGPALSACRACTRYRTCAVCAQKGCFCKFVNCCVEDCPNLMCRFQIFGELPEAFLEQLQEDEHAISCAFVLYPDDDDSDNSSAEQMPYCQEHTPEGAEPGFPQLWRAGRG